MNTKNHKNEEITAYLLGILPEAEVERLDELSFIDDDFVNELNIAEKDLIDAYVNGELAGEKLEKFESYYLASPLRRKKVEFARSFQVFAKDKAENLHQKKTETIEEKDGLLSKLFTIPRLSMQWGFACAALLFLLFGGFLLWKNSSLQDEISQSQANRDEFLKRESELELREKELRQQISDQQTINTENEKELAMIREEREKLAQELRIKQERQNEQRTVTQKQTPSPQLQQPTIFPFVLSPTLRSNNQLKTVKIPPQTDSVKIRLELESNDYDFYQVALRNPANGQVLRQINKVKANSASKSLNLSFPANLLKSQVYSLEVSGLLKDGTAEIISDYSFRAVR